MKQEKLLTQNEIDELKQLEIEHKDERNISLGNAAKARAYELMMWLYSITIVLLAFFDVITLSAFFILLGIFVVCQIYFIFRLWQYHKKMQNIRKHRARGLYASASGALFYSCSIGKCGSSSSSFKIRCCFISLSTASSSIMGVSVHLQAKQYSRFHFP